MWEILKFYNTILQNHPLKTEMITSAGLWFLGDIIAQKVEHRDHERAVYITTTAAAKLSPLSATAPPSTSKKEIDALADLPSPSTWRIDVKRTCIQTFYAGAIWGIMGHYWYQLLDKQVLKFASDGSTRFVATKLCLEVIFLHPVALCSFFVCVGLLGGESVEDIYKQLRKEFMKTLMLEWCLWTPLDIANFKYVPTRHQLLVVNTASLLDSVMLSYIKSNGLFTATEGSKEENLPEQPQHEIHKKKNN